MRIKSLVTGTLAFAACFATPPASAQENPAPHPAQPIQFKRLEWVNQKPQLTEAARAAILRQSSSAQTIPLWGYTVTADATLGGGTYNGVIVGRSPFAHGHRATTIPTYLIPLQLTFADTGTVFDASAANPCAPNHESVINLILESPLLTPVDFDMNGVYMGTGQYVDEFQRANFWTEVQGTPYHTAFSTTPTVLPVVSVTVPTAYGQTYLNGGCNAGLMDITWWDTELQTVIIPGLAAQGVNPASFPQFISDSVVEYYGSATNCCYLGYHGSYNAAALQTYSMNVFDTSGLFGGTTSIMSHEIAEWLDDPVGNNPTPSWGNVGQVSGCQFNLEVGDPLNGEPTNPFFVTNATNGVSYQLQELAFFSWFFGSASLGTGGQYSNNGTFTTWAAFC